MAQLKNIEAFLNNYLELDKYQDYSVNGLQVEARKKEIKKIAAAVDASKKVIEESIALQADLIIVHHGLFWKNSQLLIKGVLAEKIEELLKAGCSLYASHLPLDGHPVVGNAVQIINSLTGVESTKGFYAPLGVNIGACAVLKERTLLDEITKQLKGITNCLNPLLWNFGSNQIKTVAVVTGSGTEALSECKEEGIDLLVTGEPKHSAFYLCRELGINCLFLGHYLTEVFGVKALGEELAKRYNVETIFINDPSGI